LWASSEIWKCVRWRPRYFEVFSFEPQWKSFSFMAYIKNCD
jgi:hypothetical protein